MRTILDLERVGTGRWRLRVRRADAKGNSTASAPVDGVLDQVRAIAGRALGSWALVDEVEAQARKRGKR